MRVVLVGGTPAEHAGQRGRTWDGRKDFAYGSFNYAIGLLRACALRDEQVAATTEILLEDFPIGRTQRELAGEEIEAILAARPDVVGLSCASWSWDALTRSAARVREAAPRARIVVGGPALAGSPQLRVRSSAAVDMAVYGEGERAFVELCRRGFADAEGIPGVVWRRGDRIIVNPPAAQPVDLAMLPSPYLAGGFRPNAAGVLLEPSRGCRFRCAFCGWSTRRGGVRYAPRERLVAELAWAVSEGYGAANFCDTAINHDTGRMRELVDALCEGDPEQRLRLSVFLRHEALGDEQLAILARRPFDEIILGLESTNPEALRACGKKPVDEADFERKLEEIGRAGGRVTLSLMSGLPGDSLEGFERTLDYVEGLQQRMPEVINFVCCFWLAVLPGTRYEAQAHRYGFEAVTRGTPYIVRSADFTEADLLRMARMLVERGERNPKLCCEEVHREAAQLEHTRELRPLLLGTGGSRRA